MFLYKAVSGTVLMNHFDRYDDNITIKIVMVRPCLANGTLSEEKTTNWLASNIL